MPEIDVDKLVFLDESGINIDMTRRYGRAVGKARVVDDVPLNTPKTTTLLSSIRINGETVPTFFDGTLNGERFIQYLKEKLIPSLHEDDIVIMDNLRSHKVEGVKELFANTKASLVYLPPYSPDLNPIEMMWSKIKSFLKAQKCRSIDSLHSIIPSAFSQVNSHDCLGWFSYVGYSC